MLSAGCYSGEGLRGDARRLLQWIALARGPQGLLGLLAKGTVLVNFHEFIGTRIGQAAKSTQER
jgi:hypothetical protein